MERQSKVTIIGAGNVGATVGYSLAMHGTCHRLVLVDRDIDRARGKALDMSQAAAATRSHTIVEAAESYEDIANSEVVVVTAGFPRLPGMDREDLLMKNAEITKEVISKVREYASRAIVVMVANPLDTMTYVALKVGKYPRNQVIGMAGILDSARMAHFIYEKLGFGAGQIRATTMGGHGDYMVPLQRYSTVAGIPLTDLLKTEDIEEIVERTRHGGAEIVDYLKTGSAYYAPAKSTALMVNAILTDSKQIYPCAVYLNGEYGYDNIVNGVPVTLGKGGAEEIIEISLNHCEREQFRKSIDSVQVLIDILRDKKFLD